MRTGSRKRKVVKGVTWNRPKIMNSCISANNLNATSSKKPPLITHWKALSLRRPIIYSSLRHISTPTKYNWHFKNLLFPLLQDLAQAWIYRHPLNLCRINEYIASDSLLYTFLELLPKSNWWVHVYKTKSQVVWDLFVLTLTQPQFKVIPGHTIPESILTF